MTEDMHAEWIENRNAYCPGLLPWNKWLVLIACFFEKIFNDQLKFCSQKKQKTNVPFSKHANETLTYSKYFIQGALFKSAKRKKATVFHFVFYLCLILCRQRSCNIGVKRAGHFKIYLILPDTLISHIQH